MSVLKLLKSKPMPDKNAPEYKERYEREVAYGRKFADVSGISWAARKLQVFNLSRLVISYRAAEGKKAVAVQRVDSALEKKKIHEMKERLYYLEKQDRHDEED